MRHPGIGHAQFDLFLVVELIHCILHNIVINILRANSNQAANCQTNVCVAMLEQLCAAIAHLRQLDFPTKAAAKAERTA